MRDPARRGANPARRRLVVAGPAGALGLAVGAGLGLGLLSATTAVAQPAKVEALLRRGGVVMAFRHARAPGTFDPPGMRLDDCRTQRNLDDDGRTQARRIGQWFTDRGLQPARLRSSPWCRCVDTATLAFGPPEVWPVLGSTHGQSEGTNQASLAALRQALAAAGRQRGRFEVWVTHMFVLSALTGEHSDSGEGLVLGTAADGSPRVLARLMA
jgi:hypothetical protein